MAKEWLRNWARVTTARVPLFFSAYVPAWRRDKQGNLYQDYVSLDDQWVRLATGGAEAVSGLRTNVYSQDPREVQRSIIEH